MSPSFLGSYGRCTRYLRTSFTQSDMNHEQLRSVTISLSTYMSTEQGKSAKSTGFKASHREFARLEYNKCVHIASKGNSGSVNTVRI